jgi:hypothetical protein
MQSGTNKRFTKGYASRRMPVCFPADSLFIRSYYISAESLATRPHETYSNISSVALQLHFRVRGAKNRGVSPRPEGPAAEFRRTPRDCVA